MIQRTEIDDKIIITALNETGWHETNAYAITDEGLLWLDRKDSQTEEEAKGKHEKMVNKYTPQSIHICKYCAEIALTYWSLSKTWMCSHHFNIYVRERV